LDEHYGYAPSVIRPVAIGVSAHADRAAHARAAGDLTRAEEEVEAARILIDMAKRGAMAAFRPRAGLGRRGPPTGCGPRRCGGPWPTWPGGPVSMIRGHTPTGPPRPEARPTGPG